MAKTYQKPEALSDQSTHYCPGCTHGVIHRLVAEVIDELGAVRERFRLRQQGTAAGQSEDGDRHDVGDPSSAPHHPRMVALGWGRSSRPSTATWRFSISSMAILRSSYLCVLSSNTSRPIVRAHSSGAVGEIFAPSRIEVTR